MMQERWRLVPLTGQRTLWTRGDVCMFASDLYSFPPCGGPFLLNMGLLQPHHSFSVCVFISTPRGSCNCSVLMRTAPAQSTISYRNYTRGGAEGGDGKIRKVPGAARQVKHSGPTCSC
ncbi:E3 ubiquitin-protein ligase synoviolin [Dissostichus eleginoides]|uniref:E3 ubiquitin-protein ligase synoviolin n=1 Tax=Dissostichus eleginoides TaxID=100907 RepID=A0AAD9F046_DISEL|nr:E3 ubiquitin-protein ligase synoviolin [Dissostichus eleginoides]